MSGTAIPPRVQTERTILGWAGFLGLLAVAVPIALAIGLFLLPFTLAGLLLVGLVWLLRIAGAWVWFWATRCRRPDYPFRLSPPVGGDARRVVSRDAILRILPVAANGFARLTAPLLAPTALLISAVGVIVPMLRARPYFRVFTPPQLVAKTLGLGRHWGLFRDGCDSEVRPYDEWLLATFPEIPHFLEWWRSGEDVPFEPLQPARVDRHAGAAGLGRLELGPHPDPLGYPGLAMAAIRRRSVRSIRELVLSQNETDDRGDPNLDDRADAGVIRVVSRVSDAGERVWIVQVASTQSFDPHAGVAPNDITAGLVASSGAQPTLTRAALSAMARAGIRPGEPVLVTGFSLGGLVATELAVLSARTGYTITHLVTEGAPTGRALVPDGVRVLSLEHVLDSVPRLDGRRNPVGRWVTVVAGPPVPLLGRVGFTHHVPSYAETAGAVENHPREGRLAEFLETSRAFFGPGQTVQDFAATRSGETVARPAVPFLFRWMEEDGITTRTLRATLRQVVGVVAVDIYPSHTGYPTTVLWNADILVERFDPWFERIDREFVYRGLIALLVKRRAVGMHLRISARDEPDVIWEATLQRVGDGGWCERVDVDFGDAAGDRRAPQLERLGAGPRIAFHASDAFEDPERVTRPVA